jgi:hypothetical protein
MLLKQAGRTSLAKIWDQHVISHISADTDLPLVAVRQRVPA